MSDTVPSDPNPSSLRLRVAVAHWAACAVAWAAVCGAVAAGLPGGAGLVLASYLGAGVWLNRRVLRRLVDWHPVHATLDNMSRTKLSGLLLWPLVYPVLFFRLAVVRVL